MNEYVLLLHILGMATWFGSAVALNVLMLRGDSGKNPALPPALGPEMGFFGMFVFPPAILVVLASGAWMVNDAGWDWSEPFVSTGFLTVTVALIMGPFYMAPNAERLRMTIAEHGPMHADVARLKRRLAFGGRFLLLLLLVTAWMMVVKPGT